LWLKIFFNNPRIIWPGLSPSPLGEGFRERPTKNRVAQRITEIHREKMTEFFVIL
jgi:hypothetical protein